MMDIHLMEYYTAIENEYTEDYLMTQMFMIHQLGKNVGY